MLRSAVAAAAAAAAALAAAAAALAAAAAALAAAAAASSGWLEAVPCTGDAEAMNTCSRQAAAAAAGQQLLVRQSQLSAMHVVTHTTKHP